jgi:hypothetical protein
MTALEIRPEEIGVYDYARHKALRLKMRGVGKPPVVPREVVNPPARLVLGRVIYDKPIGPSIADYRVAMARAVRDRQYAASLERWRVLLALTCEQYYLTKDELLSVRRNRQQVTAKQDLWNTASMYCRWSLPQIGRASGGRDHSTILHGIRSWRQKVQAGEVTSRLIPIVKDAPLFQDSDEDAPALIAAE